MVKLQQVLNPQGLSGPINSIKEPIKAISASKNKKFNLKIVGYFDSNNTQPTIEIKKSYNKYHDVYIFITRIRVEK